MMSPKRRASFRDRIITRYGTNCCWCSRPCVEPSLEHIIPVSRGGANSLENLRLACLSCNLRRGNELSVKLVRRIMPLPVIKTMQQLRYVCPAAMKYGVRLREIEGILCVGVEQGHYPDTVLAYIPVGVSDDVPALERMFFEWLRDRRDAPFPEGMSVFAEEIATAILGCESLFEQSAGSYSSGYFKL